MTGVQSRDESGANSSDDEPLSKLVKRKRTERTQVGDETLGSPQKERSALLPNSDSAEDAVLKDTQAGATSPADDHADLESEHSSDDEPLSNLVKRKGSLPKNKGKRQKTKPAAQDSSDSDDDKPLAMLTKRKKKSGRGKSAAQNAKKTNSPQKRSQATKASKARRSSPSPVKSPEKRGQKGKQATKRTASAHSRSESPAPKKRGRPKKTEEETKVPSSDSSDDETLGSLARKKRQPEMKKAVVLLKRMSERDVSDVTQGRCHEQTPAAGNVSESSDEEPLSHKVKRLKDKSKPTRGRAKEDPSSDDEPLVRVRKAKVKDKCGEKTNGEEDKLKRGSDLGEEPKGNSDIEHQTKRSLYEAGGSPHSEPSSS